MVSGTLVITQVIVTVVMAILSALLLMVSAKIFKLKDQSFKTAIKVTLILYVINFVLSLIGIFSLKTAVVMSVLSFIVLIVLGMYLIKKYHALDWGKAALVWLVWFILSLIVGFIIAAILGLIFVAAV